MSSAATKQGLHLAGPEENGAELYNSYQLITILASIYAGAGQSVASARDDYQQQWTRLIESVVVDLGEVFKTWEILGRARTPCSEELQKVIIRAVRRQDALQRNLSIWTSRERCLMILCVCETKWATVLQRLFVEHEATRQPLSPLIEHARHRLQALDQLLVEIRARAEEMESVFELPQTISELS